MGEKADRLEQHIRQQRSEFDDNMVVLEQKVRRSVDWRAHVDERPLMMVGLAFGGGVLLSALLGGRSITRASEAEDRRVFQGAAGPDTWDIVKGAVVGLAITKLKDVVEELLPGFHEEYRRAEAGKRPF